MEFKNITDNQNIVFFDNEGALYEGVVIKDSLIVTEDGSYTSNHARKARVVN